MESGGDVISRMRALFKKAYAAKERLNVNEVIEEVAMLTQSEVRRNKVALRLELAADLPSVIGDRVQLQQVNRESDSERYRGDECGGRP